MPLENCTLFDLQTVSSALGNLTVVENMRQIPFEIRRVYYLYGLPSGVNRTPHGHRRLQQLLVAISGSFDITIDDGVEKRVFRMDSPSVGLYIPPNMWRDIGNVTPQTIILALASEPYDEFDYYRDYKIFFDGTASKASSDNVFSQKY